MTLDDFFIAIEAANSLIPGVHTSCPGITTQEVERWEALQGLRLPNDLVLLLARSNGMALHQAWYESEPIYEGGAFCFYSLDQFVPVAQAMYNTEVTDASSPYATWIAFGHGPDSSVYFVFDCESGHFLVVSPICPGEAQDVGVEIAPILEIVNPQDVKATD